MTFLPITAMGLASTRRPLVNPLMITIALKKDYTLFPGGKVALQEVSTEEVN